MQIYEFIINNVYNEHNNIQTIVLQCPYTTSPQPLGWGDVVLISRLIVLYSKSTTVMPAPPSCMCSSAKCRTPFTFLRYCRIEARNAPVPVP